jgi:hypothetical protein
MRGIRLRLKMQTKGKVYWKGQKGGDVACEGIP